MVSTPYIKVTENLDQASIQNVQGLLYLIVTETIFTFNYAAFNTFPKELPFLLRDIAGGLYESGPYYTSKVVVLVRKIISNKILTTKFTKLTVIKNFNEKKMVLLDSRSDFRSFLLHALHLSGRRIYRRSSNIFSHGCSSDFECYVICSFW